MRGKETRWWSRRPGNCASSSLFFPGGANHGVPSQSLDVTVAPGADTPLSVTTGIGVIYGKFTGIVSDQSVGLPGAIVQALSGGLIVAVSVTDLNGHYNLWVPGSGTFDVRAS